MAEAYHTQDRNPSSDRPERRGVSRTTVIEEAKAKVSTIDLADWLCAQQGGRWRKIGAEWVTNCVLNDREDRTPSFTVNSEKNVWYCHGCVRGGDVINLAQFAWDIGRADVAAAEILLTFGHKIPPRPPAYFAKGRRQQETREALEEVKARTVQRRLFRIFEPYLSRIKDPEARLEEANTIFSELYPIARMVVARMAEKRT
jgi:DNA primase